MNIYVAHSREFDFKNELYLPIRDSNLFKDHKVILPHDLSEKSFDSKMFFLNDCNLLIAEVSYPSTWLGIELAWANEYKVNILCIYKRWTKPSWSVKAVTDDLIEYTDDNLISIIEKRVWGMNIRD